MVDIRKGIAEFVVFREVQTAKDELDVTKRQIIKDEKKLQEKRENVKKMEAEFEKLKKQAKEKGFEKVLKKVF